ncbi:hypothetical protein XBKB1_150022 [Xenorhabdus bovienii str. kraussei Becker Underwood]|uniref:Uncharacterized protein n=1 Tax=Xenorhabdus bovienii str. kraussei Becker Underwood TaxID=1398204 RepID=A0A077PQ25_XENBV|nr:hypothetical protein XBKB1_150022 [Xenorhabdus bovienii str. kraussei Becker Underwood]
MNSPKPAALSAGFSYLKFLILLPCAQKIAFQKS